MLFRSSSVDAPRALTVGHPRFPGHAFVVNANPFGAERGSGPGLLRVDVGGIAEGGFGGGKGKAATAGFRDASTDRLRSDGGGAYSGKLNWYGAPEFDTRRRTIAFDFTQRTLCGNTPGIPCASPFASSNDVGTASSVTVAGGVIDGAPNTVATTMISFNFKANGNTWEVRYEVSLQRFDTDNDLITDRIVLTSTATPCRLYLMKYITGSGGGRGRDPRPYWAYLWVADYTMPWQCVVNVK